MVFKLAGAAISWKCHVQPTISLSSTEAEFLAASDAGKTALYLRSILDELHVPQTFARHLLPSSMKIMEVPCSWPMLVNSLSNLVILIYNIMLALTDWVERNLVALEDIASGLNATDAITKQTGGILFAQHLDNITGRLTPPYVSSVTLCFFPQTCPLSKGGGAVSVVYS